MRFNSGDYIGEQLDLMEHASDRLAGALDMYRKYTFQLDRMSTRVSDDDAPINALIIKNIRYGGDLKNLITGISFNEKAMVLHDRLIVPRNASLLDVQRKSAQLNRIADYVKTYIDQELVERTALIATQSFSSLVRKDFVGGVRNDYTAAYFNLRKIGDGRAYHIEECKNQRLFNLAKWIQGYLQLTGDDRFSTIVEYVQGKEDTDGPHYTDDWLVASASGRVFFKGKFKTSRKIFDESTMTNGRVLVYIACSEQFAMRQLGMHTPVYNTTTPMSLFDLGTTRAATILNLAHL